MHAGSLAHAASTSAAQQTAQRVVVPRKLPDRQTSNYSAGRQPTRRDTTGTLNMTRCGTRMPRPSSSLWLHANGFSPLYVAVPSQQPALGGYDLVLSSGFLVSGTALVARGVCQACSAQLVRQLAVSDHPHSCTQRHQQMRHHTIHNAALSTHRSAPACRPSPTMPASWQQWRRLACPFAR